MFPLAEAGHSRWLWDLGYCRGHAPPLSRTNALVVLPDAFGQEMKPDDVGRVARHDRFLRSRISANTRHAGLPASPTDFATSGTSARRKGFAAFSSASVEGMVGLRAARSLSTSASRARNAAFSGSMVLAKRILAPVYSLPQ